MTENRSNETRMPVREALHALADARDEDTLVITHQGSARLWPQLADHPLDFHYNPSTMGGAVSLGLGLAMAKPHLHIVVITGDGALAMNLGSLISVIGTHVTNMTVLVLDNGIYEVTGGQQTAAEFATLDFVGLASAIGFACTRQFADLATWRREVAGLLKEPGPGFIALRVQKATKADLSGSTRPISEQAATLAESLRQR